MTENKRFQYNVNKNCIEYDDNFVAYVNSIDGFRIANKLNCLEKENEQLKSREHDIALELNALVDENEQLKNKIDNICREINDKPTMTTTEVMVKLQELIF